MTHEAAARAASNARATAPRAERLPEIPDRPDSGGTPSSIPDDIVELGQIAGAYGVRGWLRVRLHGRVDETVLAGPAEIWLRPVSAPAVARRSAAPEAAGKPIRPAMASALPDEPWQRFELAESKPHADALLVRLAGCSGREQAAQFAGFAIGMSRTRFPAPAAGEYYWIDLVGCTVVGQQGATLGVVARIAEFGAPYPVLEVRRPDGEACLIPFTKPIVVAVDLAARRIDADWAADY